MFFFWPRWLLTRTAAGRFSLLSGPCTHDIMGVVFLNCQEADVALPIHVCLPVFRGLSLVLVEAGGHMHLDMYLDLGGTSCAVDSHE